MTDDRRYLVEHLPMFSAGSMDDTAGDFLDELVELAKEEGVELTGEQMEAMSGGDVWGNTTVNERVCPYCSKKLVFTDSSDGAPAYCGYCGGRWAV